MLVTLVRSLLMLIVSTNLVLARGNAEGDPKQEVFPVTQEFINKEIGSCPVENGEGLSIDKGAFTRVTLGWAELKTEAEIIDTSYFRCPAFGAGYQCGSAGCAVLVAINGRLLRLGHMQGWQIIDTGTQNIILGALHGSACNTAGSKSCYGALSWNGAGFSSLKHCGSAGCAAR